MDSRSMPPNSEKLWRTAVRMANWNEDLYMEDEKMQRFLQQRDKGELVSQKTQMMLSNFLAPVTMTYKSRGYVRIGEPFQLLNQFPMMYELKKCVDNRPLSLSIYSTPTLVRNTQDIDEQVPLCASYIVDPVARNTFVIERINETDSVDDCLRYGEHFHIVMRVPKKNMKYYLFSAPITFDYRAKMSGHMDVHLVCEPSRYTKWRAVSLDPETRLEKEGQYVPSNAPLLMNHVLTNKNLCLEHLHKFYTFFGQEYEVSVHTYVDSVKFEEPMNHWMIVMDYPDAFKCREPCSLRDVPPKEPEPVTHVIDVPQPNSVPDPCDRETVKMDQCPDQEY